MPSNQQQIEEKVKKTATLLGVANIMLSPLYMVDLRIAIVANAAALYYLHELGKSRRPVANAWTRAQTLFSSGTHARTFDMNNTMRNIINGGAKVFDDVSEELSALEDVANNRVNVPR